MYDYAIDSSKRRAVTGVTILIYVVLACFISLALTSIQNALSQLGVQNPISGEVTSWLIAFVNAVIPGVGTGTLYYLYNHWIWKCDLLRRWHQIPNLNGNWRATAMSPLNDGRVAEIDMVINQTWDKISVEGISKSKTTTKSYTASILASGTHMEFSYAYNIVRTVHSGNPSQMYPGFNTLQYDEDTDVLEGDYFSKKNVTVQRNSELVSLVKMSRNSDKLMNLLDGCGSKGHFVMRRI